MEATLKRVYVGGIGPSVTKSELVERFGKFGKVDDVDIISRKDEQGNPIKTFAYININISEADLKKCISLLNKTKWKGGVLQIEIAKESFLHKLEQERQQVKAKEKAKEQRRSQPDLVQSLAKAGVTEFQMKAAVPGTEVPNHKNWVVSKFGRVLPVLHLNGSKESKMSRNEQSKIIKYDPSKFCHNIKKLDDDFEPVPVSQLTWKLEGGEDDLSRKRRGEFPDYKIPPKRKPFNCNTDKTMMSIRTPSAVKTSAAISVGDTAKKNLQANNQRALQNKSINSMSDVEYDSEEEFKAIIQRESSKTSVNYAEDSNVEVVDDSFQLSYTTHWAREKNGPSTCSTYDDNEYNSADTDEMITVSKTVQNKCDNANMTKGKTIKDKHTSLKLQNNKKGSTAIPDTKDQHKLLDAEPSELKSHSEDDASGTDSSDSNSDEEYEAMMQNCYRLDLTMGDLEALAKEMNECDSDDIEESEHGRDDDSIQKNNGSVEKSVDEDLGPDVSAECTKHNKKCIMDVIKKKKTKDKAQHDKESNSDSDLDEQSNTKFVMKLPSFINDNKQKEVAKPENAGANKKEGIKQGQPMIKKKGIEPDDIIASILEDDSESEHPKGKKKNDAPTKLPAFKGLGSLLAATTSVGLQSSSSVKSCAQPTAVKNVKDELNLNSSTSEGRKKDKKNDHKGKLAISETQKASSGSDMSSDGMTGDESTSDSSISVTPAKLGISPNGTAKDQTALKMKRQQDNRKRLAAMEERRRERELQKQTIQGALLKPDASASKKTHIVFNSESDSASGNEMDARTIEGNVIQADVKAKPNTVTLFDNSEEDSDNADGKDNERFEIKAQYEGRSGEKLLHLQSRFGMDERFKMDSRFLDNSSEDEVVLEESKKSKGGDEDDLSAEKSKNLAILQSMLSINAESQPASKQMVKAQKFKDLNALQYDPTKEDHTAFETRMEEEKKESKSQRKKKRLEAEKLPEVSKDTYHEVIVDFKEVFGGTKPEATEVPETTWDQVPEKIDVFQRQKEEEPTGFTFSFFGNSVEESTSNNESYKVEVIKPAKVAWQEDPRFQDSSSEGEDEETDTTKDMKDKMSTLPEKNSIRFFFFMKEDERLKTGPKMFFRSSSTEQGAWEERQDYLMEECRKRHKAAKRKIKAKH